MTDPKKIIVLDRDGVINRDSSEYIKTPDEWLPIPGSLEAIAKLVDHGFRIFIATNQSGIGRGLFNEATYKTIEQRMIECIESAGGHVEGVFYCPHGPEAQCDCRKPMGGLLLQIEEATGQKLAGCFLVGDSLRDLQAAETVAAQGILVLTGNGRKTLAGLDADHGVPVFDDLSGAVEWVIEPGRQAK